MGKRLTKAAAFTMFVGSVAATSGLTASAAGATSEAPIKIAMLTSLTGVASSQFQTSAQGFLARIDLQNAEGGVNGHKLVPIVLNDQGGLSTAMTAVQDAVSQGAFGVVNDSPFMFAAYKYLQQNGIPVTGGDFDGPEWGVKPNTNMFASDGGSLDPTYPSNTGIGVFFKQHGGTTVATYGYGISPSSTRSAENTATSAKHAGLKVAVVDTSIPFGGVDFTNQALTAKTDHVDTVYASMDNNSNFALITALHQAGVHPKVVEFPTGFEPDVITSPAWKDLQGVYFTTAFRPFLLPDAGIKTMQAALIKYQHQSPTSFPAFNNYESWLGADLMIHGLQLAGKNPSRTAVIADLRKDTAYNGGGLLPVSINYATAFGHDLPQTCVWYLKAETHAFAVTNTAPACGGDIPGTATAAAPTS